ncbi:MAG: cyclic nucleotide-binding domain-containing protein [Candidatus Firestonebacteria bacterium]
MSEDCSERRKYKRVKLEFEVVINIRETGRVFKGTTVNLSAGGMSVLLDEFIPLGKNLVISFKVQDGLVFDGIAAKIIRAEDIDDRFIYGLEFLNMPQEGVRNINSIADIIYFIKKIKLFSIITDEEALYLKHVGSDVDYPEGKVIFSEGAEGDAFYAVINGKVRISKKSNVDNTNEEVLALIREGEFFGEMALFDEGLRTASATAHTNCKLFTITAEQFNELIKTDHKLAIKVLLGFIRTLSRRLKSVNQEMVDLLFSEAALNDLK